MVNKFENFIKRFYLFIIFLFLYTPIITLMIFSFNESKTMGKWTGFTFKWYKELFSNSRLMSALYYTVIIALLASVISTIVGTISAIAISKMNKRLKTILLNINHLPVLNPDMVTGISLMSLFIFLKFEFGFTTMLLAHITFDIPYVILSVLPKLRQLPENTLEAAADLGATPFNAILKVVIPQIKSGIVAGFLMAFTMSIDDFVISFFTTGPGVTNLSIEIYSMARRGIKPEINALSTIMFIVVLTLLLIVNRKQSLTENNTNN